MKRIFLLFFALLTLLGASNTMAQKTNTTKKDTIQKVFVEDGTIFTTSTESFKLYPTTNIYNFLLLDTRNGIIKGLQWSFDFEKRFSYTINKESLLYVWDKVVNNRFELYPTQNHYTFILLDKIEGRTWQVHWGFDEKNIGIYRIY